MVQSVIKLKKKIKAKSDLASSPIELEKSHLKELAKEIILLDTKLKRLTQKYGSELSTAKAELQKLADDNLENDRDLKIVTKIGVVTVSAKTKVRELIKPIKLRKMLGKKTFNKIAKISMSDIDKYLTEDEIAKVVKTTITGTRKISIEKL